MAITTSTEQVLVGMLHSQQGNESIYMLCCRGVSRATQNPRRMHRQKAEPLSIVTVNVRELEKAQQREGTKRRSRSLCKSKIMKERFLHGNVEAKLRVIRQKGSDCVTASKKLNNMMTENSSLDLTKWK